MSIPSSGFTVRSENIINCLTTAAKVGCAVIPPAQPDMDSYKEYIAIWDTGATGSVISQKVVSDCGLKATGMVEVSTAGGIFKVNTYIISLILPCNVIFPFLRVTEAPLTGSDLLIGMDVISRGDFSISNFNGKTIFCFRTPSIQDIDFNPDYNLKNPDTCYSGISRNGPCPCGSGKKYKKCHGAGK
jgi:hypothetical protein